jgi:hypothetical protein
MKDFVGNVMKCDESHMKMRSCGRKLDAGAVF